MPISCPECSSEASLAVVRRIELPPDSRSDEITLELLACGACEFRGAAVYQESRRGALDSESWEYHGYQMEPAALARLERSIASCPASGDRRCDCQAHQDLGRQDPSGRWQPPADFGERFPLDIIS